MLVKTTLWAFREWKGLESRQGMVGTVCVAIFQVLRTSVLQQWLPILILAASESQGERRDAC